jgi:hypothetical protein
MLTRRCSSNISKGYALLEYFEQSEPNCSNYNGKFIDVLLVFEKN